MTPGIIRTLVTIRDSQDATVKQIAIDTNQSYRTVQRHVKTLSSQGLIAPTGRLTGNKGFAWQIAY